MDKANTFQKRKGALASTLAMLLVLLLSVCAVAQDADVASTAQPESGVMLDYMDTSIKPGDNFYQYANGNWIKNTEIPPNRPDYWMGTVLYENSRKNFQKIIEQAQTANKKDSPLEFLIGALYTSYLDSNSRESVGINPLMKEIEKIDAISNAESLTAFFAYGSITRQRVGYEQTTMSPIKYDVLEDLLNPRMYALYLSQTGLGLLNREYYLNNDEESKKIREAYGNHILKMFRLAGMNCSTACVAKILDLEKSLAVYHSSREDMRDWHTQYNLFTIDSLKTISPNIKWAVFFKELGIPEVKKIVVRQPDYIRGMDKLARATPLNTWKLYLKWQALHHYADYLNDDTGKEHFRFFGNTLRGIPQQSPLPERAAEVVNDLIGDAVGQIYVRNYFSPETKARMEALVANLKTAFRKRLERADWMDTDTREKAIHKLSKMKAQIGYPEKWGEYAGIELKKDDLFGNIKSLQYDKHKVLMTKVGESIDPDEWSLPAVHLPNAYFNQNRNEVEFTAGILQPPLFNLDVDEAVIYGVVGGLIGHEITHGFDDEGGDFDENGALKNWWSASSKEAFNKKTEALVNQYNSYTVLDGLHLNGTATLGENIADLGSLNIALEAYKLSLNGKEPPVLDGFTGLQRVFLGYAQIWRGKYRDEALRNNVKSGHHSPREFRVNGVVRNIPEFYTLFDVKPTDSLYLPPEERVKIW